MKRSFHDLSVLFDDDGKAYVVWGYQEIRFARLDDDLTDVVPGTEKVVIEKAAGMGEGLHWYKVEGRYYILSAEFAGRMRMPAARADRPDGPYEVNPAVSIDEDFGLAEGYRLRSRTPPFDVAPPNTVDGGRMSLHQGGIVSTPAGEWWGFSMMDFNSVGRLTCLSPVTWRDGWPYFGLPGNLKRTPRTWVKPRTEQAAAPSAPYQRNDDFSGPALANVWQWNHVPDDAKWSLAERPGFLRLHSLPATDLWWARNTLTQRAIGPVSIATAELDASGMKPGDAAGLALLNLPYGWIGVRRDADGGLALVELDQREGREVKAPLAASRVWLRAHCDFLTEKATFSYSTDGRTFEPVGGEMTMIFQLATFQGVRYSLFHYSTGGAAGGHADFDRFTVDEPHPRGLMRPIPTGRTITLTTFGSDVEIAVAGATRFLVEDRGQGRVALRAGKKYVSVGPVAAGARVGLSTGPPGDNETFQWAENVYGDLNLLSLASHRHVRVDVASGASFADSAGPKPNRRDGSCLVWR